VINGSGDGCNAGLHHATKTLEADARRGAPSVVDEYLLVTRLARDDTAGGVKMIV
jgi:hypothetical protein